MTLVEFYAKTPIENMVGCFALNPDKVIFLCDGRNAKKSIEAYKVLAKRMNYDTVFETVSAKQNCLADLVERLSEIVKVEKNCIFDLAGGDELALVATGIVYERYKDVFELQMQKYNFGSFKMLDCDGDGNAPSVPDNLVLSVDENIELHHGTAVKKTLPHTFSDEDVSLLWKLCKRNPYRWNKNTAKLSSLLSVCSSYDNGLCARASAVDAVRKLPDFYAALEALTPFLTDLTDKGLVSFARDLNGEFSLRFKNNTVKKCLQKAGTVLELKVLSLAASARINSVPAFNDCASGVVVDWDGKTAKNGAVFDGTVNEIDLILMKRLTPIFISCKNGGVDEGELYKLAVVAEKFGSKYAKKVLIVSCFSKRGQGLKYFLERAKDFGIVVISDAHKLTDAQLTDKLIKI